MPIHGLKRVESEKINSSLNSVVTIFQRILSPFIQIFTAIGEFFKSLSPWKTLPKVTTIQLNRNTKVELPVSVPQRVDEAALKTIVVSEPLQSNSWTAAMQSTRIQINNVIKEHKVGLSIVAGLAVLAGGVAIWSNYLSQNVGEALIHKALEDPMLLGFIDTQRLPWPPIYSPNQRLTDALLKLVSGKSPLDTALTIYQNANIPVKETLFQSIPEGVNDLYLKMESYFFSAGIPSVSSLFHTIHQRLPSMETVSLSQFVGGGLLLLFTQDKLRDYWADHKFSRDHHLFEERLTLIEKKYEEKISGLSLQALSLQNDIKLLMDIVVSAPEDGAFMVSPIHGAVNTFYKTTYGNTPTRGGLNFSLDDDQLFVNDSVDLSPDEQNIFDELYALKQTIVDLTEEIEKLDAYGDGDVIDITYMKATNWAIPNYKAYMKLACLDDDLAEKLTHLFAMIKISYNFFYGHKDYHKDNTPSKAHVDFNILLNFVIDNNGKWPSDKFEDGQPEIAKENSNVAGESAIDKPVGLTAISKLSEEEYKKKVNERKKVLINEIKENANRIDVSQDEEWDRDYEKSIQSRNRILYSDLKFTPTKERKISIKDSLNKVISLCQEVVKTGDEKLGLECEALQQDIFMHAKSNQVLAQEYMKSLKLVLDSIVKLHSFEIDVEKAGKTLAAAQARKKVMERNIEREKKSGDLKPERILEIEQKLAELNQLQNDFDSAKILVIAEKSKLGNFKIALLNLAGPIAAMSPAKQQYFYIHENESQTPIGSPSNLNTPPRFEEKNTPAGSPIVQSGTPKGKKASKIIITPRSNKSSQKKNVGDSVAGNVSSPYLTPKSQNKGRAKALGK